MNPEFVFHFTSTWRDVQEKAKQIRAGGFVRVISASPQYLVGEVRGDTNIYQTTLMREPGSQRIALWDCGCAWASYSWGRSGRWKKFEGRVCSHALALNYEGQSRGWGGQQVQEDESFPLWRSDPSITVKVPGDYKKPEIGQWRLDAALRTASTASELREAPAVAIAREMLAEGASEGAVLAAFQSAGVFNAPTIINKLRGAPKVSSHREVKVATKMYHYSPYKFRQSIEEFGLDSSRSGHPPPATDWNDEVVELPRGNYLYRGRSSLVELSDGFDFYEVDVAGLDLIQDPYEDWEAVYVTSPISPDRITRMSELKKTSRGSGGSVPYKGRQPYNPKTAEADSVDGCMIAIRPPDHLLDLIHIEDGEDYDNLHMTLAYIGKADEVDHEALESAVALWASSWGELPGQLAGYGVFENGDEPVLYVAVDAPGLDRARDDLIDTLAEYGIALPDDHGFDPHLTLQYGDFEMPESMPDGSMEEFTVGSVYVVYGQDWNEYTLTSGLEAEASLESKESFSSLSESQLRALLRMSQAEGQSEVEGWVRDELGSRGIRVASLDDQALVFQSKMDARAWTEKALVLLLAGGILMGGSGVLPIVDQAYASGGNPTPITQVIEQQVQVTQQITVVGELPSGLTMRRIQALSDAVVRAGGSAKPINIEFGDTGKVGRQGYAVGNDIVVDSMVFNMNLESGEALLLHEMAHIYDSESGHTERWAEIFLDAVKDSLSQRQYETSVRVVNTKYGITVTGELKDEPEPALPETTAEEEAGEDDPRAWLLSDSRPKGNDDMDIAASARAHLAKTAVKTFSPAEQQALIDEGEGVVAANLDLLDIEGTHYESLEAARLGDDDEDWLW